jgi:hypothetical protein
MPRIIYNKKDLPITRDHTLIIIDWDDTLYPTTWLNQNHIDLTNPRHRYNHIKQFDVLDKYLSILLNHLRGLGEIIIITNAMPEWIELSGSVLPMTKKCIQQIQVVSARARYHEQCEMAMWKTRTFVDVIRAKQSIRYNNIVSLGDAVFEYNALVGLYGLTDMLPHKYLKSVRFIKSADFDTVIQQLKSMRANMSNICKMTQHCDLVFGYNGSD